jgi:hypothetical protein
LEQLLRRECYDVQVHSVSYDNQSDGSGLMLAWKGRKQPNVDSEVASQGLTHRGLRGESTFLGSVPLAAGSSDSTAVPRRSPMGQDKAATDSGQGKPDGPVG